MALTRIPKIKSVEPDFDFIPRAAHLDFSDPLLASQARAALPPTRNSVGIIHGAQVTTPSTWDRRIHSLVKASTANTAAALWSLAGEALEGINPQLKQGALLKRNENLQEADTHLRNAEAQGAITDRANIKRLADLGNYTLSVVAQGSVPLLTTVVAARAGGVPGAFIAAQTLNTAFNVSYQHQTTGQANLAQATVSALPATITQLTAGALFAKTGVMAWPVLGAAGGGATVASHKASTWGAIVDPAHEASYGQGFFDGALMGTVLGPLSASVQPTVAFKTVNLLPAKPPPLNFIKAGNAPATPPGPVATTNPGWRVQHYGPHTRFLNPDFRMSNTKFESVTGLPQSHDAHDTTTQHRRPDIHAHNYADFWTSRRSRALSSGDSAEKLWTLHRDSFAGKYPDIVAYTRAAYELSVAPVGPGIRRLHTHTGVTATVNIPEQEVVMTTKTGKIASFRKTLNKDGQPNALTHWVELMRNDPPIGLQQLSDYPLAITALEAQAQYWRQKGLSPHRIARHLLAMRMKIERSAQRYAPPDLTAGASFDSSNAKDFTPDEMIDAALDTQGRYFARPKFDYATAEGPYEPVVVRWATTPEYPSASLRAAAQWIEHRRYLLEYRNIHEFMAAAHALAQQPISVAVRRISLATGERLTLDTERNLLLVDRGKTPITFFHPQEGTTFWNLITQTSTPPTLDTVLAYSHALRDLRSVAEHNNRTPNSDLDQVALNVAQWRLRGEMPMRYRSDEDLRQGAGTIHALQSSLTDSSHVQALYPSQLEVLELLLLGHSAADIGTQLNKTPTVISNIIGRVFQELDAPRKDNDLSQFDRTHRGGLTKLYWDVKKAQDHKALHNRTRKLSDQPFDSRALLRLNDNTFALLKLILAGQSQAAIIDQLGTDAHKLRHTRHKLLTQLNIADTDQLGTYPDGLSRLRQDVARKDAVEQARSPILKALSPTRFELLRAYWELGQSADDVARFTEGRARQYRKYLDELKEQFGVDKRNATDIHFPGGVDAFNAAMRLEKQARYVDSVHLSELFEHPYLQQRSSVGIRVQGRFIPSIDIPRLIDWWGGAIEVRKQDGANVLYWSPTPKGELTDRP